MTFEDAKRELTTCVEALYRLLRGPAPTGLAVCTAGCCMPQEMERQMLGTYPRNWSEEQVQEWLTAAADQPLSAKVSHFVLPRVLDGLARGEEVSPFGVEIALKRFGAGDPAIWSEREWHFLNRFQRVFLQHARALGVPRLDSALCLFAQGGWRVEDLFDQVLGWPDDTLIPWLHANWVEDADFLFSGFWEKASVPRGFFLGDPLRARLMTALEDLEGDAFDMALAVYDAQAPK